jgi:hypothetical protein
LPAHELLVLDVILKRIEGVGLKINAAEAKITPLVTKEPTSLLNGICIANTRPPRPCR